MNWLILYSNFFVAQYLVIISENSWIKTTFLKKQTQFFRVLSPKRPFCQKQSQFKPNPNPIKANFLALVNWWGKLHPTKTNMDSRFRGNDSVISVNLCLNESIWGDFGKLTQVRDVEKIADKPGLMPIMAV